MRFRRALLVFCALLTAGLVLFVRRPRPAPPPVVPVYTPRQAADAQAHLDALRAQVDGPHPRVSEPNPRPQTGDPFPDKEGVNANPSFPPSLTGKGAGGLGSVPIQLDISQADLNTFLATNPRTRALLRAKGVQAVQVMLTPPQGATFRAAIVYKGHPANVQVTGTLLPSPRTGLRLHVTGAQVGRLPLPPAFVTQQADRIAAQLVGRAQGRLPMTVEQVQVVGTHLALVGHRSHARF